MIPIKYNDGKIIVNELIQESAEKFWISSVKKYTNNKFNLENVGKYNRAVLTFNNG